MPRLLPSAGALCCVTPTRLTYAHPVRKYMGIDHTKGDPMSTITAREAANRWGISDAAARRILAPLTPVGRDTDTGAMLYDQQQADAAHANRPGRGARSDRTATALPDEQVEQLITDDSLPVAHRALWSLLRDSHARITDALSLDVRDVDLDQRTARIEHPKRDTRPRSVPLSERTIALLRQVKGDRDAGPLITGAHGRPLGRETAARFARTVGASLHSFRPTPGTTQVKARDVQVGDVVYFGDRSIAVRTVKTVTAPSGAEDVQINRGGDFPVYMSAEEPLTIAERQDGE